MRNSRILILLIAALGVAAATPSWADFPDGIPDKIRFGAGGMAAALDTSGGVGTETGAIGTYLNLEDAFDLPGNKSTFRLGGAWQIVDRQYLDFGYMQLNRSGSHVLANDINFGKYTFLQGTGVGAEWNSSYIYVAYRYDLYRNNKVHVGGTAGISYVDLSAKLSANGAVRISDGEPVSGEVSQKGSIGLPVPLIGVRFDYAFAKQWTWTTYYRFFALKIGDISGGMTEGGMIVNWYPTKHFGLGAGVESSKINLKSFKTENATGKFNYGVLAGTLYLVGTF